MICGSASRTLTRTPACARPRALMKPTGPPPMIITSSIEFYPRLRSPAIRRRGHKVEYCLKAAAGRARIIDGFTDRRTPARVVDSGSARAAALRPGPGLREDVDHGGAARALLPLLRMRPRGGD